MCQEEKIEH